MNLFNYLESYTWKFDTDDGFSYRKGGDIESFLNDNGSVIGAVLIFILIFAVVMLVALFIAVKQKREAFGENDRKKYMAVTVQAKIVNKMYANPRAGSAYNSMVFELNTGERIELLIDAQYLSLYNSLVIGDTGELTYAGRAFIDFVRKY